MKTQLRNYVTSAMLLLPAMVTLAALPSSVLAQPAAPEVQSLAVDADAGLDAGSRLRFRLIGTPRLQASVRIRGVRENIALREVEPGVYVGRYTLKRTDRVAPDTDVRALLKRGNRTVLANFELGATMAAPPVAVAPPPPPPPPPPVRAPDPLRIERFGMQPIERIEPGAELQFALEGMPGANASVDLPGVERDLRLRETRPGHYEGSYTIRRSDDLNPNRPIVATLRSGDRVVTANLNMPVGRPGADNRPPNVDSRAPGLVQLVPAEGATVPAGPPVLITARFEDGRGSGVDPASGRIYINHMNAGRTIVFDANNGKVVAEVMDVPRATGVLAVPQHHQVYVSAAGNHEVVILDDRTLRVVSRVGGTLRDHVTVGIDHDFVDAGHRQQRRNNVMEEWQQAVDDQARRRGRQHALRHRVTLHSRRGADAESDGGDRSAGRANRAAL